MVSTKVGRVLEPSPESAHLSWTTTSFHVRQTFKRRWDFSRDGVFRSVEDSLRRTGLEYFDVVFLHDPDDHFEQATTEGIDALIEMRDQGMVSAIGAGMNSAGPLVELIRRADIDVVLCAGRYTLLDASAGEELLLSRAHEESHSRAGIFNSGILGAPRPTTAARFEYQTAPADALSRARAIATTAEGTELLCRRSRSLSALTSPRHRLSGTRGSRETPSRAKSRTRRGAGSRRIVGRVDRCRTDSTVKVDR